MSVFDANFSRYLMSEFCLSNASTIITRQEKDPMPIINNAYITHDCEKAMCKFADYLVVSQLSGELPNKVEAEKS